MNASQDMPSNGRGIAEPRGVGQNRYFVESLARGLSVLRAFGPRRAELSLSDIAAAAGVTTPSALRIGYTLVALGYLRRNPVTKGYRLGPAVLTLGMASLASMSPLEVAEPYLLQLRDLTHETVKMAVLHDTEMIYVARFPSLKYPPAGTSFVGSRLPAAQTCTGRAILARIPVDEARTIVERSRLERFTAKSLVEVDAIMTELARTRKRGYAVNDQGTSVENRSVAVALVDAAGSIVGAINISVSAQRIRLQELEQRLAPKLVETAGQISAVLPPGLQEARRASD